MRSLADERLENEKQDESVVLVAAVDWSEGFDEG